MNPYLIALAGMLRGVASAKQQQKAIDAKKAGKRETELEIERQKMLNTMVENYMRQQGYGQMNLEEPPTIGEMNLEPPPETDSLGFGSKLTMPKYGAEQQEYKPVYQSTENILKEMGQPMGGTAQAYDLSKPSTTTDISQPYRPPQRQTKDDLFMAAMIQGMSKGQIPLFNLAKEQQDISQWKQNYQRMAEQDEFNRQKERRRIAEWEANQERLLGMSEEEKDKEIQRMKEWQLTFDRMNRNDKQNLANELQRRNEYIQTEARLAGQSERDYMQRESATSTIPITIEGVPHLQTVDRYQNPVGQPRKIGEKKGLAPEQVGKIQGAKDMKEAAIELRKALVKKDGSIDRMTLAEMQYNIPFSNGRDLVPLIEGPVATMLHLETGAGFTKDEIKKTAMRIVPSIFDSDKGIKAKLDRIEAFANGSLELFDPGKVYTKDDIVVIADDGRKFVVKPKTSQNKTGKIETAQDWFDSMGFPTEK